MKIQYKNRYKKPDFDYQKVDLKQIQGNVEIGINTNVNNDQ